jgi:hypothetical protein
MFVRTTMASSGGRMQEAGSTYRAARPKPELFAVKDPGAINPKSALG